tara:strand:- start:265 stop:420 length:156 start_codon:yes stop_codon:yes gene_type:complete
LSRYLYRLKTIKFRLAASSAQGPLGDVTADLDQVYGLKRKSSGFVNPSIPA